MFDVNDDARGGFRRIEVLTGPGRRRPLVGGGEGADRRGDAGARRAGFPCSAGLAGLSSAGLRVAARITQRCGGDAARDSDFLRGGVRADRRRAVRRAPQMAAGAEIWSGSLLFWQIRAQREEFRGRPCHGPGRQASEGFTHRRRVFGCRRIFLPETGSGVARPRTSQPDDARMRPGRRTMEPRAEAATAFFDLLAVCSDPTCQSACRRARRGQ